MINHARTLLLNISGDQAAPGFDDYIPADFAPVRVPADMFALRDALQLGDSNLLRLKHTAAGLLRLLHAPDMDRYARMFDPRTTYRLYAETVEASAYAFDAKAALARLTQLDSSGQAAARLFAPWPDYAEPLSALLALWRLGADYHVRLAAATAGYVAQLERTRLGLPIPVQESTLRRYP